MESTSTATDVTDGSALTIPAATDTAVPGGSQMCAQLEADTDVVS